MMTAVVADEVKKLVGQFNKASQDIEVKVQSIENNHQASDMGNARDQGR